MEEDASDTEDGTPNDSPFNAAYYGGKETSYRTFPEAVKMWLCSPYSGIEDAPSRTYVQREITDSRFIHDRPSYGKVRIGKSLRETGPLSVRQLNADTVDLYLMKPLEGEPWYYFGAHAASGVVVWALLPL